MISLPVKYRPQTLEDVIGQSAIVQILKRQAEMGNIKNAYLFAGNSGSGKTTVARAFAMLLNNGMGSPIEIDAASNNGVDNIRQITQESKERAIDCKYKIYIIDEAHALSNSAWQAFLKSIEEPPELTIFIFCTTDPQKIPATILNRVQRFNFNKIPTDLIKQRLEFVCKSEGYINYEDTIQYISKVCDGCMREALTLLGKVADSGTTFDINNTISALGDIPYKYYFDIVNAFIDDNEIEVLRVIEAVENVGGDLKLFIDKLLRFVIDVLKYLLFKTCEVTSIPSTYEQDLVNLTNFDNPIKYYNYVMDKLLTIKNMLKDDTDCATTVRVVCLQLARMQ